MLCRGECASPLLNATHLPFNIQPEGYLARLTLRSYTIILAMDQWFTDDQSSPKDGLVAVTWNITRSERFSIPDEEIFVEDILNASKYGQRFKTYVDVRICIENSR